MGEGGCVWVRWGTGGVDSTKTSQAGGMKGVSAQDLGAMVGEISPDIMFSGVCQKNDVNGCRWMQSCFDGCVWTKR